jgi:hypothetical protein
MGKTAAVAGEQHLAPQTAEGSNMPDPPLRANGPSQRLTNLSPRTNLAEANTQSAEGRP